MIVFSPAPRCKPGVQRLVEPMTAACYLRLRRARSGLSRRDLAYRLSSAVQPHYLVSPAARIPALDEAMALIDMLETDGARARYRWTIEALAAFIPMDVDVYHQLASDPEERHPQVCRGCACTEGDIASSSWAVANLCVSCLKRDAALAEVR